MKPVFDKTPEEQIIFWREVMGALKHEHRKKFSQKFSEDEIQEYCQKMIDRIEKDINEKL